MRITYASATNFGSFGNISINYGDNHLTLVSGATGSGKSTLLDIPSWVLFGKTSKGGAVEEIRSWGTSLTEGTCQVVLSNGSSCTVTRIRGKGEGLSTDLYWKETEDSTPVRGKDLSDTQRLLEQKLGIGYELFITASYFHEFSPVTGFYTATAKQRRQLFEQITDLSFVTNISEELTSYKKVCKTELEKVMKTFERQVVEIKSLHERVDSLNASSVKWALKHKQEIERLANLADKFKEIKLAKIVEAEERVKQWDMDTVAEIQVCQKEITKTTTIDLAILQKEEQYASAAYQKLAESKCSECGGPKAMAEAKEAERTHRKWVSKIEDAIRESSRRDELLQRKEKLVKSRNPHIIALTSAAQLANSAWDQLTVHKVIENPFLEQINASADQLLKTKLAMDETAASRSVCEDALSCAEHLEELVPKVRAELLFNAIKQVESDTNRYLSIYFDGEISVEFTPDNDKLDIKIQKNGNDCVYTQLSKGQRGLLKLTFAVSLMEMSSNNSGVHFDNLFFDEALDGFDMDLKVKAYSLFEELATRHKNILVIDHSIELQNMFSNQILVTLDGDKSQIETL